MSNNKDKGFEILINGTEETLPKNDLSFEELVDLAFPNHPTDPNVVFSVTFEHADSNPHQGTLAPGRTVTVKKKGTTFDVTQTNRS